MPLRRHDDRAIRIREAAEAARSGMSEEKRDAIAQDPRLGYTFEEAGVDARTYGPLHREGYEHVYDVLVVKLSVLIAIDGFGDSARKDLYGRLKALGFPVPPELLE